MAINSYGYKFIMSAGTKKKCAFKLSFANNTVKNFKPKT